MAIIFNKTVNFDEWVLSEDNLILDFYSDYNSPPLYCDVTFNGIDLVRLYPHPDESFYTNLKEFLNTFVNKYKKKKKKTTKTKKKKKNIE